MNNRQIPIYRAFQGVDLAPEWVATQGSNFKKHAPPKKAPPPYGAAPFLLICVFRYSRLEFPLPPTRLPRV